MGDTFRYKGENVSTAEVAAVLGSVGGESIVHALVYGVSVPAVDGKVGMAALVLGTEPLSMARLFEGLDAQLPAYAHPRFLRLLPGESAVELTHTFKPKKERLLSEGFDPDDGSVFVRDAEARTFVPLDASAFDGIMRGERKLG